MLNTLCHKTLRIAGTVKDSIVDGPGIRYVVFTQGCPHHCPGCHNPQTHDFHGGYDCEIEKILNAIGENPMLDGVTFSGGEPLCQPEGFLELARGIRSRFPQLNIVIFTGYTWEELMQMQEYKPALKELLQLTDLLIEGRYEQAKRDLTLQFRGSTNQRIIDMNATREAGLVVLSKKYQ